MLFRISYKFHWFLYFLQPTQLEKRVRKGSMESDYPPTKKPKTDLRAGGLDGFFSDLQEIILVVLLNY